MAPKYDNFIDRTAGGLGGAMGQYFKWNFSQSPAGISAYSAGVTAGLKPSTAFAGSLLTTAGLQYATNEALKGRDRESKKPTFGDSYGLEDQVWDNTVGLILPNQGKVPRNYADYTEQVKKNNGSSSQTLTEDAYSNWKNAEYNQGGVFRLNREGQGSEIVGRDTATVFNRTVANPLYAYDGTLGRDNVDRLTTGLGFSALAGSAVGLRGYNDLSKVGATVGAVPAYTGSQTARILAGAVGKGLGTAAIVYGGITDFAESKKAGDSDLRAASNAISSTTGGLYGATQGFSAGATAGAALGSVVPGLGTAAGGVIGGLVGGITGGLVGSNAGGYLSDRALDVFGEGRGNNGVSADTVMANAESRYQNALASKQQGSASTMSSPNNNRYDNSKGTVINSSRPSDYSRGEKRESDREATAAKMQTDYRKQDYDYQGNLYKYSSESGDRRYATDSTSNVNYKLGSQKNQVDLTLGLDKNAVTRDVGFYTSDNQLKASNYKSYGELQAKLDQNRLQSGDNRYDTTTKYQTQKDINKYQWDNVNQTSLAEAQVKSGTYGMSKDAMAVAASNKNNFDSWKRQNDANFDYADRQNAQIKLGQDIGRAERAYSDQRLDRQNDQAAAHGRWQHETAVKAAERGQFYADQKVERDQQRADFGLRSQQIQAQINSADRDYGLRAAESIARVNQINTDSNLKNQQFGATRADIGYNRGNQSRSLGF